MNEGRRGFASPACSMHEVDPAYAGYLPAQELVAELNQLLEAERAGAKLLRELANGEPAGRLHDVLEVVAHDEARYCAVLRSAIARLDGDASRKTGAFREKVLAENGTVARLRLLNRGQDWVVRRVEQLLPKVADDLLHAALVEMRDTHRRNIADCAALLEE